MLEPAIGTRARPAATPLWKVGQSRQCGDVSLALRLMVLQRGGGPRPDTHSLGRVRESVGGHARVRSVTMPLEIIKSMRDLAEFD